MLSLLILNPEQATEAEISTYKKREAARAIVQDNEGNIALLHVQKHNYYKLPGGGIDKGESIERALERECLEEIGCRISNISEIGIIKEYRKMFQIEQTSYCYFANVSGPKMPPAFTESELANNFAIVWLPPTQAIQAVQNCKPGNQEGKDYIVPRDICFLETAQKIMS